MGGEQKISKELIYASAKRLNAKTERRRASACNGAMRRQRGFDSLLHEHETSNQSVGMDEMNRPPFARDSRVTMNPVLNYEGTT